MISDRTSTVLFRFFIAILWAMSLFLTYTSGYNRALDQIAARIRSGQLSVIQRLESIAREIEAMKK